MKHGYLALGATLALATGFGTAVAHHSFSQQYDAGQPIRLTGTVTEMSWQNPHSHIYLEVREASGQIVKWAAEGYPPAALRRQGFARDMVKVGDVVTLEGWRARGTEYRMAAQRVTLPDGRAMTFGPTP